MPLEKEGIIATIKEELTRARKKHAEFPKDPCQFLSVIMEELGEAAKEIKRYNKGNNSVARIKHELVQAAVVILRSLEVLMSGEHQKREVYSKHTQLLEEQLEKIIWVGREFGKITTPRAVESIGKNIGIFPNSTEARRKLR